jgi:predicted nucleotidyltransferase
MGLTGIIFNNTIIPVFYMKVEMKDQVIDHLFCDVERELKALFGEKLSEIILYGSYARGDYDDKSDIDIIVLVEEEGLKKYDKQVLRVNVDLSLRYDVDLSVVVENKTEFDLNRSVIPLYKVIDREGKILYAA